MQLVILLILRWCFWLFTGIEKWNKIKNHCFSNWLILVEMPQIKKALCVLQEHPGSVLLRHLCHWAVISCLLLGVSQQSWDEDSRARVLLVASLSVPGPDSAPKLFVKWVNESNCTFSFKVGKLRFRFKRFKIRVWGRFGFRQSILFICLRRFPKCVST